MIDTMRAAYAYGGWPLIVALLLMIVGEAVVMRLLWRAFWRLWDAMWGGKP